MKRPPRTVLVVEDLDDDFDTVAEAAEAAGARLVRARTLGEARALVRSSALVLLDVNLPDGPADAFVRAHRAAGAVTPVVVFSTSVAPRDVRAMLAAGANAYHVKSLRQADALATLAVLFAYWLTAARLPA